MPDLSGLEIAIAAPCPLRLEITNGWLDRIYIVDLAAKSKNRIYFNFAPHHEKPLSESIIEVQPGCYEAFLSPEIDEHNAFVDEIIEKVSSVYVHTLHGAELFLDRLATGKIIVDIHGVTPEEEEMLGNPKLKPKYEKVEQKVLKGAKLCVMVSEAMRKHYSEKYSSIDAPTTIIPIVQSYESIPERQPSKDELPVRVIYAGGLQAWQNIDGMFDVMSKTKDFARLEFLSDHWKEVEPAIKRRRLTDHIDIGYVDKSKIGEHYARSDFGFVLRDDNAVNRVACPTKLFDYLSFGVIPIVRSAHLGDFIHYGYNYVTEEDFCDGFFPDRTTRAEMQQANYRVVARMREDFDRAFKKLEKIL